MTFHSTIRGIVDEINDINKFVIIINMNSCQRILFLSLVVCNYCRLSAEDNYNNTPKFKTEQVIENKILASVASIFIPNI